MGMACISAPDVSLVDAPMLRKFNYKLLRGFDPMSSGCLQNWKGFRKLFFFDNS